MMPDGSVSPRTGRRFPWRSQSRSQAGGSFVACETVERLKQRIDDRLAERLFLSGVSIVNAAMTTQSALDQFVITSVVFSGIAGGVDPALNIGDVVIADQWGQYLEAIFARKTVDGFVIPPFFTQEFPGYGMIVPKSVRVTKSGGKEEESRFWFPSEPRCWRRPAKWRHASICAIAWRRTSGCRRRRRSSSGAMAFRVRSSSTTPRVP
jgi:nucleoside phosphorylase